MSAPRPGTAGVPAQQKKISSFFSPKPGGEKPGGQTNIMKFFSPTGTAAAAKEKISKASVPEKGKAEPAKDAVPDAQPEAEREKEEPKPATPAPAATAPALDKPASKKPKAAKGGELVGRRIKIYWAEDEAWYKGAVTEYDVVSCKHHVLYDDAEEEWVDLAKERTKLIVDAGADGAQPDKKKKKKDKKGGSSQVRKRRVILSDDEDGDKADGDEDGGDGSGSEYEADSDGDSDDDMEDLEDEMSDKGDAEESGLEDDMDDDDATMEEAGAKKRKRSEAPIKSKGGAPTAASTPKTATPMAATPTTANPFGNKSMAGASAAAATPKTAPPMAATPTTANAFCNKGKNVMPSSTKATPPSAITPFGGAGGTPASATPQAGANKILHDVLDVSTSTAKNKPTKEVVHGVRTVLAGEAERFLVRMAEKFPFLHPDRIKDAKSRKPSDDNYDPRTLFVPPTWFKDAKISEGQQQWWGFKAQNFDSVLLFKMGKFYEMFEMDAYVAADVLGLAFMKGDQPHAGFPEVKYHDMAEGLARAGYRVVVVEQTETPDQLAERNEERRKSGLKKENVVTRQKVAVLSKGTMIDAEMVQSRPDASYVMAVFEQPGPKGEALEREPNAVIGIGLCIVDVASAQLIVGQFNDDEVRSCLRTHLTAMQPVEVLLPKAALSSTTMRVLRTGLRDPRFNTMRGPTGEWTPEKILNLLNKSTYFKPAADAADEKAAWPEVLRSLCADPSNSSASLSAMFGMTIFLKDAMLDEAVLPLGRIEALPDLQKQASSSATGCGEPTSCLLNGAALENLEVLENAEGGSGGTLLGVLDHCCTPFGRRRLRQWLCRPLFRVSDISRRQDAVAELMGAASEAAGRARKDMAGISDLERAIARLHASTCSASGREAANVILYEDGTKRKVKAVKAAIQDLQTLHRAISHLQRARDELSSDLLLELTDPSDGGRWFHMHEVISELANATDWKEAEATGRVVPATKGVDPRFDAAVESIKVAEAGLQTYLKNVRQRLGCREISYVSFNKESHLMEVPESTKVPSSFDLVSHRKGFKRYMSDELRELVVEMEAAQQEKEAATAHILQVLIGRFVEGKELWMWAVEAVSELDALMSLAAHALNSDTTMCRPELVPYPPPSEGEITPVVFEAKGLRHPAGLGGRNGQFVPNDISLGTGASCAPFLVLTGPNMGGKSTLLRQVCLTTLLAQVGACVPAESLRLSPVDALFVRMGAKDSIMTGQSTFYIELAETAAMLLKATPRSLVALDELGRGTATLDGAAIASAVLHHMAHAIGCRGLFATHYHHLSSDYVDDPSVSIMHMACAVSGGPDDAGNEGKEGEEVQEVTFLHKLTQGACPKSYGTNVARLAGLPASVVIRAAQMSARREDLSRQNCPAAPPDAVDMDVDAAPPAAAAALGEEIKQVLAEVAKMLKGGMVGEGMEELKVRVAKVLDA